MKLKTLKKKYQGKGAGCFDQSLEENCGWKSEIFKAIEYSKILEDKYHT